VECSPKLPEARPQQELAAAALAAALEA